MRGWRQRVIAAPWFDGEKFSLVDAVFGPVFRYFDMFDEIGDFGILAGKPKVARWRKSLAERAVGANGGERRLSGVAARLHRPAAIVAVGIAGGQARCGLESELGGHFRQRRHGIHVARGARLARRG